MSKEGKKCSNCNHSRKIMGTVDKEFKHKEETFDCTNPEVKVSFMEKYNWNHKALAKRCEHYDPKLIKRCSYCDDTIKKPKWDWYIWAKDIFGNLPVCSLPCRQKLEKELEKNYNKADSDEGFDEFNF